MARHKFVRTNSEIWAWNRKQDGNDDGLVRESGGLFEGCNAVPYVVWPSRLSGSARQREAHFSQIAAAGRGSEALKQASSLADLMNIRAIHSSKVFAGRCLGTALGFRTRCSQVTDVPAIIVFVRRKLHKKWLQEDQLLPRRLQGTRGLWCDVDVVEFSYYGGSVCAAEQQIYSVVVEGIRGNDTKVGVGSQVASVESYGTMGAIVRSRIGDKQVGFLTNRHVAVDLDLPNQKIFHPLPPNLGAGTYLGAVERATSFAADELWYGIYASPTSDTFVRADGAFVPFCDGFDMTKVTTKVRGLETEVGEVMTVDLEGSISEVIGKKVVKLGRSSGVTKGTILGYAVEYNDDRGNCFFTDFLIVGDHGQQLAFDLEGDSGSLILEEEGIEAGGDDKPKPRALGMIWGGTGNRGRLKLRDEFENWTSGVDLGRLLDLLKVDMIPNAQALEDALKEQEDCRKLKLAEAAATPTSPGSDETEAKRQRLNY